MADQETLAFDSEFASFRNTLLPQVTPAGPDVVRFTVRRRRRIATTAATVVALALITGPIVGYAALHGGQETAPAPADSTDPAPSPTPSASALDRTPDGRIDKAELLSVRVDLPAWQAGASCPAKQVRLVKEAEPGDVWLALFSYGDVDRDGAQETLVVVRCLTPGGGGPEQLVALDRDREGRIVTIGRVVATDKQVEWLSKLDPRPDGSVRVKVADVLPYDDQRPEWAQYQWRTYGWNGERFEQIGGPTAFEPNPLFTDLRVTGSDVVFADRPGDEWRHGSITVTVRNAGNQDARNVTIQMTFGEGLVRPEGTGWSACKKIFTGSGGAADEPANWISCELTSLPADSQRTLILGLANSRSRPDHGTGEVLVYRTDGNPLPLPDRDEKDNKDLFDFR